jgi:hypothetical protein
MRAAAASSLLAASMLGAGCIQAQELEPRAYSASPVGTNFVLAGAQHSSGEVLPDPALPVTDIRSSATSMVFGYARNFGLLGRSASVSFALPYVWLDARGNVGTQQREVSRTGPGDPRVRLAVGLIGAPALTPDEFAERRSQPMVGASLTLAAPLGQYDGARLVNIGSNRWSFKPEVGVSFPFGKAFAEAAAGAWLFTDNDDFFGGQTREQDPLWSFQLHAGYNFRPGFWLAANATYFTGGRTTVDGAAKKDLQSNSRYGVTLSYPLQRGIALKLAWSTGFTTRVGGDFDTWSIFLQYRWFDGNGPGGE